MTAEHRCEDEPVADPAPLPVRDETETPEVHLQLLCGLRDYAASDTIKLLTALGVLD